MRDDSSSRALAVAPARVRRWPERRAVVLLSSVLLFLAIFLLRELVTGTGDALSLLYVIPVALAALELGVRAGVLSALAATAATGVWIATVQTNIGLVGMVVRGLIYLAVGTIAGRFSDQMRRHSLRDESLLLALRAAVASENRRLLEIEREQAELSGEIERMRKRLGDQVRNASRLIEHHEQQRRGIARRLHDDAAQAMAGALLTVGLLERGVDQEMSRPQLEEVRAQVKACIVDLRHIAGSLRPPALDELGLAMALERFAHVDEHGVRPVGISLGALPERLPAEVETATYRAIEEMLDALADAGLVSVSLSATEDAVQIVVRAQAVLAAQAVGAGGQTGQAQVDLVATRARVELIGGSLRMTATPDGGKRILVEIPIASEGD
jgi:signal transduction histidine kinase